MKRTLAILGATIVLSGAVVACGGGRNPSGSYDCTDLGSSACAFVPDPPTDPPPAPTPPPLCVFPNITMPQMVYPIPGAGGVSRTLSQFVVADTNARPYAAINYGVAFSTFGSALTFVNAGVPYRQLRPFQPLPAAQVPAPSAPAAAGNTIFESAIPSPGDGANVTLNPNTTYYAYMYYGFFDCTANGPIGSFTTGNS